MPASPQSGYYALLKITVPHLPNRARDGVNAIYVGHPENEKAQNMIRRHIHCLGGNRSSDIDPVVVYRDHILRLAIRRSASVGRTDWCIVHSAVRLLSQGALPTAYLVKWPNNLHM